MAYIIRHYHCKNTEFLESEIYNTKMLHNHIDILDQFFDDKIL